MRSLVLLVLWSCGRLFADVVILNDGRVLSGSVESGNSQELHLKTGDQAQTIDIHQVQAIQFGVSSAAAAGPAKSSPETRTLILKDGTKVTGKWWSIDAGQVHFLVNNQLQHYARSDVSAVTSGDAPAPPPAAPAPATAATAPPAVAKPQAPTPRSSSSTSAAAPKAEPPPAASKPQPPAAPAPPSRPSLQGSSSTQPAEKRGVSQPDQIGAVYYWNGHDLTPLERSQAVERKRGSTQYWEMSGAKSSVRVEEASAHAFIVRLPRGVNPASYSLFPLTTDGANRQTRPDTNRKGGIATWPFEIQINNESGYMTYAFIVKDLPTGEYSFSPSDSNNGYCFGVDASPGQ